MANTAKKLSESLAEESAPMQVVKNDQPAATAVEVPVEQPAPQPELTLEQRISMVEDLTMLIDRWRKLQESYRNLQTFKIGTDGMSTQIVLRDTTSGKEFKTSNSSGVLTYFRHIETLTGKQN